MADIEWPRDLMPPSSITVTPVNRRVLGPVSLDGTTQMIAGSGGHWSIKYQSVPIHSPDQIRTWRSIASRVVRGQTISVPIYDFRQAPHVTVLDTETIVPHSDGTYFSDGTGYIGQPITAKTAAATALRATSMQIQVINGGALLGGEYFSIRHAARWGERLYLTETVEEDPGTPGLYAVTFSPPLREATPTDTDINFADPRCTCWLEADESMGDERAKEILTRRNVSFVEAFP